MTHERPPETQEESRLLRPIEGERLVLCAFTRGMLLADLASRGELARETTCAARGWRVHVGGDAAEVSIAPDWPNEHWDADAVRWLLNKESQEPGEALWRAWMILVRTPAGLLGVGTMGCKGPPDARGFVEVGYGVVRSHWRRHIASDALRLLVSRLREDPRVRGVCAYTRAGDAASAGVCLRSGLTPAGGGVDAEVGPVDRFELVLARGRDYAGATARVRQLLDESLRDAQRDGGEGGEARGPITRGVGALPLLIRQRAVTRAYWEFFGSKDPASTDELQSGRGVSWCGFYDGVWKEGGAERVKQEMVLVSREPKPACSPIGLHGMCGLGWREARSVVVRDVRALGANYVACDPRDMSELVVPVFEGGVCVGVFDVDSYHVGAFEESDARGAEEMLGAAGLSAGDPKSLP